VWPKPVLRGQGSLESIIADDAGRIFFTDSTRKALMRLDAPGLAPVEVLGGIESPGGLAWMPDGTLLVGQGNGFVPGALGNLLPQAKLLRVDVRSSELPVPVTPYATGLQMANGVARAPNGFVYASSDVGIGIDRIAPGGGKATPRWATVVTPNGLAVDAAGQWLYAVQTFQPAGVIRISLSDPKRIEQYSRAAGLDIFGGPDGMTLDPLGRPVHTAWLFGQIWRVNHDRSICVLGKGLTQPSAVAYVRNGPFGPNRLYSVGFDGMLAEIPAGAL
jgi:streptogramin lyase